MIEKTEIEFEVDPSEFVPALYPFINDPHPVQLFTGTAGSGKSVFLYKRAVLFALCKPFFRLIYSRKVAENIRDSTFLGLKDVIDEWGLRDYFHIRESNMDILCKLNKNSMLSFGLDKPEKLKSVKDPTHFFIDEFSECSFQDYAQAQTRLRTMKVKNIQFWGAFNPVVDFDWARQYFFADPEADEIPKGIVPSKDKDVLIVKTTYHDNPHIDRVAYEKKLKELGKGDENHEVVYEQGNWGKLRTGNEYFHQFSKLRHVQHTPFIPDAAIHLSFDFNVLPYMTLVCSQLREITINGEDWLEWRIFDEYCLSSPMNTTEGVCKAFIAQYEDKMPDLFYYGDASGLNRIPGKGDEYAFKDVELALYAYLSQGSKRVEKKNHNRLKRRDLMNKILSGTLKIILMVDPACQKTIKDLENCRLGIDGKEKKKVTDPKTGATYEELGHTSDALEAAATVLFKNYLV